LKTARKPGRIFHFNSARADNIITAGLAGDYRGAPPTPSRTAGFLGGKTPSL
jgi:hypothetical protein